MNDQDYQELKATAVSGSMADITLEGQDKREYNACLSVIAGCYSRMATNRDTAYRAQQKKLVDRKLERMTELLEADTNKE